MRISTLTVSVITIWLCSVTASAQLTIGPEKLPVAGDRYVPVPMDTTGILEGAPGANKVWDMSGLVTAGPATTIRYLTAGGTPYAAEFPGTSLASLVEDGVDSLFSYFSLQSNRLTLHGSANESYINRYFDPEVQMTTPMNYLDQFSDQFRSVTVGEDYEVRTNGSVSVTYDGYGTLIMPGNRTISAARLKFSREAFDTAFVGGDPVFSARTTTTSFEWFAASQKFPVLQIAYHVQIVNNTPESLKLVMFNNDFTTDVDPEPTVPSTFELKQNFPNPFNPSTTIAFTLPDAGKVSLKIFNLLGGEVATLIDEDLPAGIYAVPFEARDLASGTYLYRLQSGPVSQTRKLTLIK